MNLIGKYLSRLLSLWVFWFWFVALDALGLVIDTFVPSFSPPRWLYWLIPAIGFLIANVKLFAENEVEKQRLLQYIADLEDTRADIRFAKLEDFVYIPSSHAECPFAGLEAKIEHHTQLSKAGMPGWIVIGVRLRGMKKSAEPGELVWEITEAELPSILTRDKAIKGSFQLPNGFPLDRVDEWKDDFEARYELPIRIADKDDVLLFARNIGSLKPYRVVVDYCTDRGIDSVSRTHELVLEGDFRRLYLDICKKWEDWGFENLLRAAR